MQIHAIARQLQGKLSSSSFFALTLLSHTRNVHTMQRICDSADKYASVAGICNRARWNANDVH